MGASPWTRTTASGHGLHQLAASSAFGLGATWVARSHHECQRALAGQDPLNKVKSFLGWDGYGHAWNLVKYTMGSHDDIGDQESGNAEHGLTNWDARHRYLVDQFGGRENWWARAKCRLAWALNAAMPGTPLMFMGSECHMASPFVSWGYHGQWTQMLCTQDAAFGGWDGAGNAFFEPWTQADGHVYINLPKWSVVMFRRK